ncbi:hypothetical protein B0H11DRAFT_2253030 [Mycena galericulata]|nr:hypothetical protein B0H11DRAFT_2253030 [Mycena galericulata]
MSEPPEYDNDELADLIASLSDLDLASLQITTPGRPHIYEYHSPTKSGRTSKWSEAAHHSQGVAGGSVQRVDKSGKAPRPKPGGYAVFYGRDPGTYSRWSGPHGAGAQVTGVSGALHQGYPTVEAAKAAFEYALTRGWTGRRPSPTGFVTAPVPSLPIPVSPPVSTSNPLHTEDTQWYVVYAGITPGVYCSYLECALNTVCVSGATYESAGSRAEAERYWATALAAGLVRFLTHPYSE